MDFQQFNKIFTSDFNLDTIFSFRQTWSPGSRYNCTDSPRRNHGIFLITDYPAVYDLPDGSTLRANPGDIVLLPMNSRYAVSFIIPEGKESHPLIVNFRMTDPEGKEITIDSGVVRLTRDDGTLLPLFTTAAQLYKGANTALLKAKVYELFGSIFPLYDADECCINYINHHYTHNFSIPELAKRCALSETSYRKRFKQLTGLSPVQYINRLKIDKACQMLANADISPGSICSFLNFYSLPYFYKVFKDITGLTPNQYREHSTQA